MLTNWTYRDDFVNWGEYLEALENRKNNHGGTPASRNENKYYNSAWSGTDTWKEAFNLAKNGYPDLANKINPLSVKLFNKISRYILRPETVYHTEGYVLDVGRWIDGEPEHWLVREETENEMLGQKIAHIIYNGTVSCGIPRDVMEAKGATICSLIKALDYANIRCDLTLVYVNKSGPTLCTVKLKTAAQDLDMDLVSFAIGHVASFRRVQFGLWETWPTEILRTMGVWPDRGYGYVDELTNKDYSSMDLYIGGSEYGNPNWTDTNSAIAWVKQQLIKFGVVLQEE